MGLPDPNLPPDPFNADSPDLMTWAAHVRGMYTSLVASGFKENEAFEFTLRVITAMMTKGMK